MYNKSVKQIQDKKLNINYIGAFLSYICVILSLFLFSFPIVKNEYEKNKKQSLLLLSLRYGGLLGLFIYGIFNTTNITIFTNYNINNEPISLDNNLDESVNYNDLLKKSLVRGFIMKPYVNPYMLANSNGGTGTATEVSEYMEHEQLARGLIDQVVGPKGFMFEKITVWHAFAAVVRALETYRFPFDWKTIQKHCMQHER